MLVGRAALGPNEGTAVDRTNDTRTTGQLVLVATPLGNLGDISRRALELLSIADVVYCEDTRHSRTLFSAYDIAVHGRLQSLHEHNEASQCAEVIERVRAGQTVVLISDAGTPAISDPGSRVVAAVADAGLSVSTVPGPSALIAALTISGLDTERFCMEGFVPRKRGERDALFEQWAREERTVVFYESPQRLANTLEELASRFATRRVAVAREITKLHEEVVRGTLEEVAAVFGAREVLGEVVVVLEGAQALAPVDPAMVRSALREQLNSGASVRDAVASVADALGVSHRDAYRVALEVRAGDAS
jgi:16S rRNA (cytidine1402-2'-O)-methyltransferase